MSKVPSFVTVTKRAGLLGAALILAVFNGKPGHAIDWQINQSIAADVSFSDNVDLDPDNSKEEGITPGATYTLAGTGQGGRTLFAADARIRLRGATNKFDSDIDQRIFALGRGELISDRLFLDGLVSSTQELRDANSAVSANPNAGRNATDSVTTVAISPVYQEKLGTWADTQLSYEHREVWASGNTDDASMDSVQFGAVADRRFTLWQPRFATGWTNYREHLARPTNSKDDVELVFAEIDNRYQVSRNYALLGLVGYNEVDAPSSNRDLSGFYWNVGVSATPNPRTQFDIRIGQRFDEFGINGSLSYAVSPNLTLRADARHDVGTALVRSGGQFQRLTITQLQGGLTSNNGLPTGFVSNNQLDDGLSTEQSFGMGLVGTYGRNGITFGSRFTNRSYDTGDDIVWVNRLGWTRQLSRSLSVDFSLAYRYVDDRNRAETQTFGGRAGFNYQLGQNSSVFGFYSRTNRTSPAPQQEYTENAITIGGRLTF